MRSLIFYFTAILFYFSCNSCDNRKCCITDECYSYEFKLPITISPLQDTFRIGDTITLTSSFSDEVEDLRDGRKYELKNFDFYPTAYISKIDTFPYGSAFNNGKFEYWADAKFSALIGKGTFEEGIAYGYNYINGQYSFSLKFRINEPGLYCARSTTAMSTAYDHGSPDFPDKCDRRLLDAQFYMNDRTDNNYHMRLESPDTYWKDRAIEDLDKFGLYFFVVVP